MWKGAMVAAVFFLAACAADEEQRRAAAAQAEAQIAQQDHARCLSYGKPGSAAYIDCRSSLKNDRADHEELTPGTRVCRRCNRRAGAAFRREGMTHPQRQHPDFERILDRAAACSRASCTPARLSPSLG